MSPGTLVTGGLLENTMRASSRLHQHHHCSGFLLIVLEMAMIVVSMIVAPASHFWLQAQGLLV
jgi:uncharacterized protein YqhQ